MQAKKIFVSLRVQKKITSIPFRNCCHWIKRLSVLVRWNYCHRKKVCRKHDYVVSILVLQYALMTSLSGHAPYDVIATPLITSLSPLIVAWLLSWVLIMQSVKFMAFLSWKIEKKMDGKVLSAVQEYTQFPWNKFSHL